MIDGNANYVPIKREIELFYSIKKRLRFVQCQRRFSVALELIRPFI